MIDWRAVGKDGGEPALARAMLQAAHKAARLSRGRGGEGMGKQYLGDSVYADFDGYMIRLTTENGAGPSNTIDLEPAVLEALDLYRQALIDGDERVSP